MVPFHDTDVEGERWSQAEWVNYELWEKVEIRKKRRKRLLLLAAAFIWFCLSAVPILTERWPRWIARSLIRHCAQQVNQVKLEAVIRKAPVRIRFQGLAYTMEVVHSCQDAQGVEIRSGTLSHHRESQFRVLQAEDGLLPIVSAFCYDPLLGSNSTDDGIAIALMADIEQHATQRTALLLLHGASAELNFD